MIYRGYKIEKGREGWDIYHNGARVHGTDNQTQAMEWCDEELKRLRERRNAV